MPHTVVCGQDKHQNDGELQHSPSLWESHAPGNRICSLIIQYLTNILTKDTYRGPCLAIEPKMEQDDRVTRKLSVLGNLFYTPTEM